MRFTSVRNPKILINQTERGEHYLSTYDTKRPAEAGIEASVGKGANSFETALAESVIRLFRSAVIRKRGPWRGAEDVEFVPL
jgi:putative transposase